MKEQLLQWFSDWPQLAILISIAVSVVIAIAGVIPSFFITAANILFFGFWQGTLISFMGEAIGAFIAFMLYRKGFKKRIEQGLQRFPKAKKLSEARGREAFMLILSLRLLPFVPSGLVTFAAAVGSVSPLLFLVASSLGKLPALLIEAYSVNEITQFSTEGKILLGLIALALIYFTLRKKLGRK